MRVIDFYTGCEGMGEYQVYVDGVLRLRTWSGYFHALLKRIIPGNAGVDGLLRAWHEDLWDDVRWPIPDLAQVLQQVQNLRPVDGADETKTDVEFREAFVALLTEALETGKAVSIQYE